MSDVAAPTAAAAGAATGARLDGSIPFARLLHVEVRKLVDTRAGRWLLIVIGVVVVAVIGGTAVWGSDTISFWSLLSTTYTPLGLLLPVVGILGATQEWSQRTGLVTFALEPRRVRVGLAKLVAALVLGLACLVVTVVVAAAAYAALAGVGAVTADWSLDAVVAGSTALALVLAMAQGVAFGLVLQNTPPAIVAYFVLPTVFSVAAALIPAATDVWPWIDLSSATSPLLAGQGGAHAWAQLAVAALIWVAAPLVAGLVRLARSEIKSS